MYVLNTVAAHLFVITFSFFQLNTVTQHEVINNKNVV